LSAKPTVICLICFFAFFRQLFLIDIDITKHKAFLLCQLFLINSVLHFGQVMQIFPLPFGTLTVCLHCGHLKKR
jgi:hypothetical protein